MFSVTNEHAGYRKALSQAFLRLDLAVDDPLRKPAVEKITPPSRWQKLAARLGIR